jgi:hypothetical protein
MARQFFKAGQNALLKAEIERLQKIIGKQAIQIEILKNRGVIRNKVGAVKKKGLR